ncbi:hypothetical protein bcgnr5378_15170 [Bacillus cereus]|uniref:hypothetical protein n=1 Tax=Bacillus cereus TaxID=1396 RepID=UPI001F2E975E|nr:hypothetical protein [Bacillus cereus]MCE7035458.1 hypothetical protein [Bacillus cereus]BCC45531.1 hypothetical protein BCJMU02_0840 [Bacillus cereus]HDR4615257.1 hypothetical protein [Bacillus cereus]HDR4621089.1 hypothetical protein [Bacillus cereus]
MKLAKTQIQQFISKQLELCELKEINVEFAVRGLDFNPNMFIGAGEMGLEIGFYRLEWNSPVMPDMIGVTHHILLWEHLDELSNSEKSVEIKESIIMVAEYRKRRYQQCKFCDKRTLPEHLFEDGVCQGCATVHFGVMY